MIRLLTLILLTMMVACVGCGESFAGPFGIALTGRHETPKQKQSGRATSSSGSISSAGGSASHAPLEYTYFLSICPTDRSKTPFIYFPNLKSTQSLRELLRNDKVSGVEAEENCYKLDLSTFVKSVGLKDPPLFSCRAASLLVIEASEGEDFGGEKVSLDLTVTKRLLSEGSLHSGKEVAGSLQKLAGSFSSGSCNYNSNGIVDYYLHSGYVQRGQQQKNVYVNRYILLFPRNFMVEEKGKRLLEE